MKAIQVEAKIRLFVGFLAAYTGILADQNHETRETEFLCNFVIKIPQTHVWDVMNIDSIATVQYALYCHNNRNIEICFILLKLLICAPNLRSRKAKLCCLKIWCQVLNDCSDWCSNRLSSLLFYTDVFSFSNTFVHK